MISKYQIQGVHPATWMIFTLWSDMILEIVQKKLEILWKQKTSLDFQVLCILHSLKIYM